MGARRGGAGGGLGAPCRAGGGSGNLLDKELTGLRAAPAGSQARGFYLREVEPGAGAHPRLRSCVMCVCVPERAPGVPVCRGITLLSIKIWILLKPKQKGRAQ